MKESQQYLDKRASAFAKLPKDSEKNYYINVKKPEPKKGQKKQEDEPNPSYQQNLFSVFSAQSHFISNDIWQLEDKFNCEEINLYIKKLQYVQNVINESYRDLILCTAVCSIPIILSMTVKMAKPADPIPNFTSYPNYAENRDFSYLS